MSDNSFLCMYVCVFFQPWFLLYQNSQKEGVKKG